MWAKYSSQDTQVLGTYAVFPATTLVLPSAIESAQRWSYTTGSNPGANWMNPGFNTSSWSAGYGGFGTVGTPDVLLNTPWKTSDIYMRLNLTVPSEGVSNAEFEMYDDGPTTIYINGVLAATDPGVNPSFSYEDVMMSSAAVAQLVAGQTVTIAVHSQHVAGFQAIDVGILGNIPGDPQVVVANANATTIASNSIVLTGTPGSDHFIISFNAGNATYSFSGGSTIPGTVAAGDVSGFSIAGDGGSDVLSITGGSPNLLNDAGGDGTTVAVQLAANSALNMFSTEHLSAMQIASGAVATMEPNGADVLVVGSLSLAGSNGYWTGKLDLTNNSLIVRNGNLAVLTNLVGGAFASKWAGSGITNSTAAGDTAYLTAVGVIQNSVSGAAAGSPLYNSFQSQPTTNTDVLIKYTYFGDTNLDGKDDGSDYSRTDAGYLARLSGWFNGDFNYDGIVNGSDYALLDNTYNRQGASLAAQIAAPAASVAVAKSGAMPNFPGSMVPISAALPTGLYSEATELLLGASDVLDHLKQS